MWLGPGLTSVEESSGEIRSLPLDRSLARTLGEGEAACALGLMHPGAAMIMKTQPESTRSRRESRGANQHQSAAHHQVAEHPDWRLQS